MLNFMVGYIELETCLEQGSTFAGHDWEFYISRSRDRHEANSGQNSEGNLDIR